jgi:hypothetical protein
MNRPQMAVGLFAVAGIAMFGSSSANAQSALGPYLALGAGYDEMPDRNLVINGHAVSSQWKTGYGALAAVGYKWYFGLRTEAEYSGRVA